VFRRWVVFLFATELATERGITDDYHIDGRVLSVRPSVNISPTEFIPVTDGMSPSVKLFNGVVSLHLYGLFLKFSMWNKYTNFTFLFTAYINMNCFLIFQYGIIILHFRFFYSLHSHVLFQTFSI
jgi:hypothetical protein